ncbi:DUF4402 domain-containing protein [Sphingomonas sp. HDW15A]|uniref:DUF4402 domain-containing protein n=1 Tax=Sphingomonas sp. HDW15A TaxID=2714942 RepID=UPI00140DEE8F|nr:DUF4402 domain-containing protein [Sphingomonas sp. HDW15A]QIK96981.1 DUF4402 domain-containing protein [Sphingomonas sp. HDW15A]
MFNQFKKTALVAAAGLAFVATPAFAANGNPATETGTAKVRILQPLSIDNINGTLDFGVLVKGTTVAPASYYNFTVDTAGAFGGCDAAWACSATKTAANFTVSGAPDESVQVTIDPSVDLDGVTGATNDFLDVDLELSGDDNLDAVEETSLVLTGGDATFSVGGTLRVRGDVLTGTYSETFTVSAEYL